MPEEPPRSGTGAVVIPFAKTERDGSSPASAPVSKAPPGCATSVANGRVGLVPELVKVTRESVNVWSGSGTVASSTNSQPRGVAEAGGGAGETSWARPAAPQDIEATKTDRATKVVRMIAPN